VSIFPHYKFCLHALLRGWAVVWMLVVPLIHIHPEADRHHGEVGHVHGGTVHTVFSRDLDGEFDIHYDTKEGFRHGVPSQVTFSAHSGHAFELSEWGFSYLSDSTDRKLTKPVFSHDLIEQSGEVHVVAPPVSFATITTLPSPHLVLTCHISSRAPPSLLV